MTPSSGVTVTAVTQLSKSEIMMTVYRERVYSPVESCEVPIAANASTAITVAPNRGQAVCLTTSRAALRRSMPCWNRISMPSTMTIALSTSMPSAMISAPRDIRSRVTSCKLIKMKLPQIVRSRMKPMSRPLRSPMKNSSTTTTMTIAWRRLMTKPWIAVCTASDWTAMTPNCIPSGMSSTSSYILALSFSPISTTLPPEAVEMPMPMAGWPSKRSSLPGGSL